MSDDHSCRQGARLLRLERDAAAAEADRRKLREDIAEKLSQIVSEVIAIGAGAKLHNDAMRAELRRLEDRYESHEDSTAKRLRAVFGRIDELRALLGAEGHA